MRDIEEKLKDIEIKCLRELFKYFMLKRKTIDIRRFFNYLVSYFLLFQIFLFIPNFL